MSERVPEGWKIRKLDEVLVIPKKEEVSDPQKVELLTVKMHGLGIVKSGKFPKITENGRPYYKRFEGEILVGRQSFHNGGLGLVKKNQSGLIASNAISSLVSKDNADINFFYQLFLSDRFQIYIDSLSVGTGQKEISEKQILECSTYIPPLLEQKKIASILTSVDEVIEKTQSQIDKLQNLKKATMNELLTRGIGHTEFKDSELGRIPKSWEVRPLREICDVCSSKRVMQSDYVDKGVPFFRSKEIILKSKGEAIQSVLRISEDQFLNLSSKFGAPKSDDILITAVGTIGISYLVGNERFYFKDGNLLWLRNVESIFPSFLSVFLSAQNTRERIIEISGGSSQSALTIDKLSDFLVPIPSQLEQKQIFDTTNVLEGYIGTQKKKLSQTQALKKSLMQDLLTGKVRVSVN